MATKPPNPPVDRKASRSRLRLGDLLLAEGLITQQALDAALIESGATGKRLGRVLVHTGAIGEEKLALILAHQLDIKFVNLSRFAFRPEVERAVVPVPPADNGGKPTRQQVIIGLGFCCLCLARSPAFRRLSRS